MRLNILVLSKYFFDLILGIPTHLAPIRDIKLNRHIPDLITPLVTEPRSLTILIRYIIH